VTILLLLGTDVLLVAGALALEWSANRKGEPVPLSLALPAVFASAALHVMAWLPYASARFAQGSGTMDYQAGMSIMATLAVPGAVPAFLYGRLLLNASSHTIGDSLFGLKTAHPVPSDYSKARTLAKQGQAVAAVR